MLFQKQLEKMYYDQIFTRQDATGDIFYFSAEDFEGLQKEPFSFPAIDGHNLQGYFYHYGTPIEGRLVVFDHGMGCGHRAYLREIEIIARHGYLVFAYDHTGCAESEGANTGGFAQSLSDLDACITALKKSEKCHHLDISVVGHSWGAYAVMNIVAIHPEISHVVALSGFISVETALRSHPALKALSKQLYQLEEIKNPAYAHYNALESLSETNAKVLLYHSSDDKFVSVDQNFHVLKNALSNRANIRFKLVNGKGHNPNYTEDAVRYKDAFFADLTEMRKKNQLTNEEEKKEFIEGYDWLYMTEQDEVVWTRIFKTLDA